MAGGPTAARELEALEKTLDATFSTTTPRQTTQARQRHYAFLHGRLFHSCSSCGADSSEKAETPCSEAQQLAEDSVHVMTKEA